jgi:hypothetical protein
MHGLPFRLALLLSAAFALSAAPKTEKVFPPAESGNDILEAQATAIVDKESVTKTLGMDPGMSLLIVQVKITPKFDNKVKIYRDDFTLLSTRDGERSHPLEPGQIAGRGAMIVTSQGVRSSGGLMGNDRGPIWGGIPGTGSQPRRMGGQGTEAGNGSVQTEAKATINKEEDKPDNPLLAVLKSKILPETESNDPTTGLLYFLFEANKPPKVKDLTLIYKSQAGKLVLDFKTK